MINCYPLERHEDKIRCYCYCIDASAITVCLFKIEFEFFFLQLLVDFSKQLHVVVETLSRSNRTLHIYIKAEKKKHCSKDSYAGTFKPNLRETNKCKSKIYCSLDSNQPSGMGFMINWFIDWSHSSLLQHVVL